MRVVLQFAAGSLLALSCLGACRTVKLRARNENAPVLAEAEAEPSSPRTTPIERAAVPGSFRPEDLDFSSIPIEEVVARLAGLGIHLRPEENVLEVSGRINLEPGPVEFLACTPDGPVERSLVVLDCVPSGLHAGLLALGLVPRPARGESEENAFGVDIYLRWQDLDGGVVGAAAAELLWIDGVGPTSGPLETGAWIFTGSGLTPSGAVGEVAFAADLAGRLVALRADGRSVLGRGATAHRYRLHPVTVPARGTSVTAIFSPRAGD